MVERVIHSVLTKALYAMVIMCLAFAGAAYAKPVDSDITPISVGNDVTSGDTTEPEPEEETPLHHTQHGPLRDTADDALQAPPGKSFLLEKGFADVDKRDAPGIAAGDEGYFAPPSCGNNISYLPDSENYFGPGKHLPVCETRVYTRKSCPKNFIPVMKITPYSTSPSILTPIFACIGPSDAQYSIYKTGLNDRWDTDGYQAYVQTPATSADGGTGLAPFVSFSWEVHCYPNKKFVDRSASSSTMFAQENLEKPPLQHCHIPDLRNIDYPVLLWDLGTIRWPGDWRYPDRVQTTTTHRKCPNGYEPYATISAGIPYENHPGGKSLPGSASLMNPSGVCVNSLTDSSDGSAYIINYIARASTMQIEFSATNLEIHDPTVIADFGPIEWKLFCYPPNMSPPSFASNCSLTNVYYKPD